jgi:sigma-B regulation protein RsbU (phosphoserine phosphatase)
MPLGLVDPIEMEPELTEQLLPGDVLVLFTDGLIEAMSPSGDQFGTDRLRTAVESAADRPAEEIVARVFAAVDEQLAGATPLDDMTIVVVKVM